MMNDMRLKLWSEREIRWKMKKSKISETGEAMPPMDKKYMGNFAIFEGNQKGAKSLKLERHTHQN